RRRHTRFSRDWSSNVCSSDLEIFLDENNNGTVTLLPSQGGTVAGTYTLDANGLGGGMATWTDTRVGTFTFIFYLISPTEAVFQEIGRASCRERGDGEGGDDGG